MDVINALRNDAIAKAPAEWSKFCMGVLLMWENFLEAVHDADLTVARRVMSEEAEKVQQIKTKLEQALAAKS